MSRRPYRGRSNQNNYFFRTIIAGIILIAIIGSIIQFLLPILFFVGAGYGIYYLATRQTRLNKVNIAQRLQNLKDEIQIADRQVKLLDSYLDEKDYTQYTIVARQLLPKVKNIKTEALDLREEMDLNIYKRVLKKATEVEEDISLQLEKLDISPNAAPVSKQEKDILQQAPELRNIYNNIQQDHAAILDKIAKADNKAELTAIHETNMNRFKDILAGYLKIKSSPKDYYNADERLAQARAALEKFDLDLDETLRKLNESDLKDFDISLRMMTNGKTEQ